MTAPLEVTGETVELRLDDGGRFVVADKHGAPLLSVDADTAAVEASRVLLTGGGPHPDLAAHNTLGLATQGELDAHEVAADPHTGYALDTDLTAHAGAADPHAGYQRESEKGLANGYAGLDSGGTVPDAQIPASIARDSELVTTHAGLSGVSADQHHAQLHATAHQPGGGDAMTVDAAAATGSLRTLGSGASQAASGNHSHGGGSEAFPVGAVFIAVVSTNPATLLGYGTWAAFGAGRVLVGLDSADTDFDVAEETGGAKTKAISAHAGATVGNHTFTQPADHTFSGAGDMLQHTHATDSQGAHVHDEYRNSATTGGLDGWGAGDTSTNTATLTGYDTGSAGAHTHTAQNPASSVASFTKSHASGAVDAHSVGQASAHTDLNVVQPYIVVYMWKRTA